LAEKPGLCDWQIARASGKIPAARAFAQWLLGEWFDMAMVEWLSSPVSGRILKK
jgi:hypothetical protein